MERGVERDLQVLGVRRWRELVADRKKMEGHCSTGQSPQWAVVPMEEEEVEGATNFLNSVHGSRICKSYSGLCSTVTMPQ